MPAQRHLHQVPTINLLSGSTSTAVLACPRCGGRHIHQKGVAVFDRAEDANAVRLTEVAKSVTVDTVDNLDTYNPSARRNGLLIQFECENCHAGRSDVVIELTIAQHKGETEIGWRYTPQNA